MINEKKSIMKNEKQDGNEENYKIVALM